MSAKLRQALTNSIQALDDVLNCYADDLCDPERVAEARARVKENGGFLAYVGNIQTENREALGERKPRVFDYPDTSGWYFFVGSLTHQSQENFQFRGVVEVLWKTKQVFLERQRGEADGLATFKGKFLKLTEKNLLSIL